MKKFFWFLNILFCLFCLGSIASYFTPRGRSALLVVNTRLAQSGFSLWQYFWLAMALTGIAIALYIAITRKGD